MSTVSIYHPGRPCSECILCGKKPLYYSHYGAWRDPEKEYIKKHLGIEPDASSCICASHQKDAKRPHHPDFIPKWKKSVHALANKHQNCCMNESAACSDDSRLIVPSFISSEELRAFPGVSTGEHLLCNKHYQEVYRHFNHSKCAGCGIQPKTGSSFTRHRPNPSLVNSVLNTTLNEDTITSNDTICLNCYKNHLVLIKSVEEENKHDLQNLITIWERVICDDTLENIEKATLSTVMYVANELISNRAMLLPHVAQVFLHEYLHSVPGNEEYKGKEGTIKFSSKWLLKQLLVHLHLHMNHRCVHKKVGTVLYSKREDLVTSLSWALGKACTCTCEPSYTFTKHLNLETLDEAGTIVNKMIHKEINKIGTEDQLSDPTYFNIDKEISKVDPKL